MACFCFLKAIVDLLSDDKTAYERRFGKGFSGPVYPFGAEVTYLPISDKDKARCHQFGKNVLSGIFLGYDQQEGGGWSGDLLILDWEEIENAEHFSDIHIKVYQRCTGVLSKFFRVSQITIFIQLAAALASAALA